jgi:hypothetical protein
METAQTITKKLQIISEESAQNAFVNQEPSRFLISLFDTFWLQDPLALACSQTLFFFTPSDEKLAWRKNNNVCEQATLALVCHKFLAKISDISAHFSPEGKNIS